MKTRIIVPFLWLLLAMVCAAAQPISLVCGATSRDKKSDTPWIVVPVKITNTSGGPVCFQEGGVPGLTKQFVSRRKTPDRWKDISPSMKGMCALGYQPPTTKTLAPGESHQFTCSVWPDHAGHWFRVSIAVSTDKRKSLTIRSEPILLK